MSALLEPPCLSCGELLDAPLAGPICERCWLTIPRFAGPTCSRCGEPLALLMRSSSDGDPCPHCGDAERNLTLCGAIGPYEGTLRTAIHALKYDGRRSLAGPLAALMRARCEGVLAGADAVVPVPLHRARKRQRGFNQADDLAAPLGLPLVPALRRVRATHPQADLPAEARRLNVLGAFVCRRVLADWRGATLVLVDDVSTTGATLETCARALREGGAAEVRAITAGRAVKTQP